MEIISNIINNLLLLFVLYIIFIKVNNVQKNDITSKEKQIGCNIINNNTITLSNTLLKNINLSKYSTYLEIQNEKIYIILFNKESFNKQLLRLDVKSNSIDWIGGKNIKTIQLNNSRTVMYHEKDVLNKGFQLHTTQNISKNTFKNNFYLNVPSLQKYITGNSILSNFDIKPNTAKLLYITKQNKDSIGYTILHYEESVPNVIHVSNDIPNCKRLQDNWYIDTIEKTINQYNINTCFSNDLDSFLCTSMYQKKRIVFIHDFINNKKICRIDQNVNPIHTIKAIQVNNISGWICSEKRNNLTNSYKILYYFKKDNKINLSTYSNPHFISHLEVTGDFVIFTEVTTSMISNLKIYKLDSKLNLTYVKMISIGNYIAKDLVVDNKKDAVHCTQLKISVFLNDKDEYKVNIYGVKAWSYNTSISNTLETFIPEQKQEHFYGDSNSQSKDTHVGYSSANHEGHADDVHNSQSKNTHLVYSSGNHKDHEHDVQNSQSKNTHAVYSSGNHKDHEHDEQPIYSGESHTDHQHGKKYYWSSQDISGKYKGDYDCNPCKVIEAVKSTDDKQIYKCSGEYDAVNKQTKCNCEILVTDPKLYPDDFKDLKPLHPWGTDTNIIVQFPRNALKPILTEKVYNKIPLHQTCSPTE